MSRSFRNRLLTIPLAIGLVAGVSSPAGAFDIIDANQPPPTTQPPVVAVDGLVGLAQPIPRTGWGDDRLDPVLDALDDFMRHRCVGAATIGISYQGVPIGEWGLGRTNGRASSSILDEECGDNTTDPYDASASDVNQYTPLMIGSVSKPFTAATVRWVIKQTYFDLTGDTMTDTEVEALRLFGDDFPVPLVPQQMKDLYTGVTPLPPELDVSACEVDGQAVVDPRWSEVTVGQMLAHRAGLPRSAPDYQKEVVPRLAFLRGLESEADFEAAHNAQRALAPNVAAFDAAQASLADGGDPVYFLGAGTIEESLMVVAGRCLAQEPGDHVYSNTSPGYWDVIIRQLDPSGRYTSEVGNHPNHTGSALQRFFAEEVGLNSFGNKGIFRVIGEAGVAPTVRRVPQQRNWSESQQTYVPLADDPKRPHCVFSNGTCNTTPWRTGERADWTYAVGQVPFHESYSLVSSGTGSLAAEPRHMLQFMSQFWIGGYGNNPKIGEPRNGVWNSGASHVGSLSGGRAYAWQFGGGTTSWKIPALTGSGRISDEFTSLHNGSAPLPAGLDVFVAINQRTDPKCQASEAIAKAHANTPGGPGVIVAAAPVTYDCGQAYELLSDFVRYGLGQVDWDGIIADLEAERPVVAIPSRPGGFSPNPSGGRTESTEGPARRQ